MKLSKYMAISVLALSIAVGACGCDKDYTIGTPFENTDGSGNAATAAPGKDADPGTTTAKPEGSGDKTTPSPTKADNGTKPGSETVTPTSTEPTGEAVTDIPSVTPTDEPAAVTSSPVSRDKFDRTEYRDMTFLIWLPAFENGAFTGQDSQGTFDYAVFSEVKKEEVTAYISELKKAGYTVNADEKTSSDTITYSAYNDKDWKVVLSYKDNTLRLGSGFEETKEDNSAEEIRRLYSTTMLQYVPEFKGGSYMGSSGTEVNPYITYSGVSKDAVLSYIEQVKNAGYIYAPEENYSDTSTWYIALNEDSFECHVEYDGNILKIGCVDCRED